MPDAKYINIRGYKEKFAFLWAIDYFYHDFPVISLAPSESFRSWNHFFRQFQHVENNYDVIVCDDNAALKLAAVKGFPLTKIQTCYNHLKENYRRVLKVRSQDKYRDFMTLVEGILCSEEISVAEFDHRLKHAFDLYQHDSLAYSVLNDLKRREKEIHAHRLLNNSPKTTNLIESFNSQLQSRLFSIRTFQSYEHASLWLNGYVLKRRFTPFTNCKGRFKDLNGRRPIEITLKDGQEKNLPKIFKKL